MTSKTTYYARKAAGLCVKCGQLATHGQMCETHRNQKDLIRGRTTKVRYEERKAAGLCVRCGEPSEDGQVYCTKHRQESREVQQTTKEEVFSHYGNRCACCGETNPLFLSVDHINNDGARHRASLGWTRSGGGRQMYFWLKRNNYPEGFQLLCYNCNIGKAHNGGICPHKTAE